MILTDESLMPNGKYVGVKMANVPAFYLIWCYDNDRLNGDVKAYVKENYDVLQSEANK